MRRAIRRDMADRRYWHLAPPSLLSRKFDPVPCDRRQRCQRYETAIVRTRRRLSSISQCREQYDHDRHLKGVMDGSAAFDLPYLSSVYVWRSAPCLVGEELGRHRPFCNVRTHLVLLGFSVALDRLQMGLDRLRPDVDLYVFMTQVCGFDDRRSGVGGGGDESSIRAQEKRCRARLDQARRDFLQAYRHLVDVCLVESIRGGREDWAVAGSMAVPECDPTVIKAFMALALGFMAEVSTRIIDVRVAVERLITIRQELQNISYVQGGESSSSTWSRMTRGWGGGGDGSVGDYDDDDPARSPYLNEANAWRLAYGRPKLPRSMIEGMYEEAMSRPSATHQMRARLHAYARDRFCGAYDILFRVSPSMRWPHDRPPVVGPSSADRFAHIYGSAQLMAAPRQRLKHIIRGSILYHEALTYAHVASEYQDRLLSETRLLILKYVHNHLGRLRQLPKLGRRASLVSSDLGGGGGDGREEDGLWRWVGSQMEVQHWVSDQGGTIDDKLLNACESIERYRRLTGVSLDRRHNLVSASFKYTSTLSQRSPTITPLTWPRERRLANASRPIFVGVHKDMVDRTLVATDQIPIRNVMDVVRLPLFVYEETVARSDPDFGHHVPPRRPSATTTTTQ